MAIKSFIKKRKQKRKESKAFKSIVEKRALQVRRKAFEEEALKVAREKGMAEARKPRFREKLSGYALGAVKKISSSPTARIAKRTSRSIVAGKRVSTPKRKKKFKRRIIYRNRPTQKFGGPKQRPISVEDFI